MATSKKPSKTAKPLKKEKPKKPAQAPKKAKTAKAAKPPVAKKPAKKAPAAARGPQKAAARPAVKPANKAAAKTARPIAPSKPARRSSRKHVPFKKNQQVVYPLQGVGKILSIESRMFKEKKTPYYIIYLDVSDMTVMVPVDKADSLGIRSIVSKRTAEKALAFISDEGEAVPTDWKLRYQMNFDLLKQGSVGDIARVVRTLYQRSKIKELPILERKLFDSALKLLIDEVSFAMNRKKDDIEQLVFSRLEADLPEKLKTPVAARDEDDDYESFDEEEEEVEDDDDSADY